MEMYLFRLTLMNRHTFFVVAPSWNAAEDVLIKMLDQKNMYFTVDRKVREIERITDELLLAPEISIQNGTASSPGG